jgi:multidrug efflux pump subunit AcrB
VQVGRRIVERLCHRAKIAYSDEKLQGALPRLARASVEDVHSAVGRGELRAADVARAMYPDYKEERAAALGLTVKQISDQVVGKLRGRVATRYSWRDRKIDVLVRMSEEERQSIDAVRELIINPQSARPVPLSAHHISHRRGSAPI